MKQPAIGSYRDADGTRHELAVRETTDGGWLVLDLNREGTRVIETLDGGEDGCPQAEAIARDYLSTLEDTSAGRTPRDPIPEQGGPMPATTAAPVRARANAKREGLRCRVRLADGRVFSGALAPERHRALQLGVLHEQSDGLVELAAGARRDGRLQITTRRRANHFLPGGRAGGGEWLEALLDLAGRHADRGEEVFVAPAVRAAPRGEKQAVTQSRFLWVDVDQPGQLHALWVFLAERPCHLLVESSGERWRACLLEARSTATGHKDESGHRRARRADRARPPAADPPPRRRLGRQAERR